LTRADRHIRFPIILGRVSGLFIQTLKDLLDSRIPLFRFRSQRVPEQRVQHLHVRFEKAFVVVVFL
jgi:hypothetical protein